MKYLIMVVFALFFSACSLSPTPNIPEMELPSMDESVKESSLLQEKWWENFGDSGLNA